MRNGKISNSIVRKILNLITGLGSKREEIKGNVCVDDAAEIALNIPSISFSYSHPIFFIDWMIDDNQHEFSSSYIEAHRLFKALWEVIDLQSPYKLSEHWPKQAGGGGH